LFLKNNRLYFHPRQTASPAVGCAGVTVDGNPGTSGGGG